MSALGSLTQTTGSSVTTLPAWYNTAQQNVLDAANKGLSGAPGLSGTVAQNAINTLSGTSGYTNPFTQATGTLNTIASGAANPWITDPNTGAVTPNTSTAMGGLFAAQQNELNQLLPTELAQSNASAIGSGNFGSLRGQTAVDTASANALAQLRAAQMQAALTNQQTGVTAAANQGNVGEQGIIDAMKVGQAQMTAPFTNAANYGNIIASLTAPTTVNTSQTPSALAGLTGVGTLISGGLNSLLGASGVANLQSGFNNLIGNSGFSFGGTNPGTDNSFTTAYNSGPSSFDAYGNPIYTAPSGASFDSAGNSLY